MKRLKLSQGRVDGETQGTRHSNRYPPSQEDAIDAEQVQARVKSEPLDPYDSDVIVEDGDQVYEFCGRPERIVNPPEFDDEMRAADAEIMDDIRQAVGEAYRAPAQMMQIVASFQAARQQDPRRNGTRDLEPKAPRCKFIWSQQQDQQIVAMTLYHLNRGADMTKIAPYADMKRRSPLFQRVQDPRNIMRRLQVLCSPQNCVILEDYCGHSAAESDAERAMALDVAQTIRASCLDLRLVKQQKLDKFIRPKISSKPIEYRRRIAPPADQNDEIQLIEDAATTTQNQNHLRRERKLTKALEPKRPVP